MCRNEVCCRELEGKKQQIMKENEGSSSTGKRMSNELRVTVEDIKIVIKYIIPQSI